MAYKIKTIEVDVTTTAAAITNVKEQALWVHLLAPNGNAGNVFIGEQGKVSHSTYVGVRLTANSSLNITIPTGAPLHEGIKLDSIWAAASTGTQKLIVTYLVRVSD